MNHKKSNPLLRQVGNDRGRAAHGQLLRSAAPWLSGFVVLAIGAAATVGHDNPGNSPDTPPTTRTADCTAGGCHAQEIDHRFLHAPVAVGACDSCHIYDEPAKHTFLFKHTGAETCNFCHIGKTTFATRDGWAGLHVHEPVRDGDCTACHNPHGGALRNLIETESVSAMCLSCHESTSAHANLHTPVAEGDCLGCHQPHSSMHEGLLVATGRSLCMQCHSDVLPRNLPTHLPAHVDQTTIGMMYSIAARRINHTIHEPMHGECSECHDHHGSAHPHILKQEPYQLCISCHESVASTVAHAPVEHSALSIDRACLNCHAGHFGHTPGDALLRDRTDRLCATCHTTDVARADGSIVEAQKYLQQAGWFRHTPISDHAQAGRCQDCHTSHGGTRPALLTAHYSTAFYQSYTSGAYELCISCHDPALATAQFTISATKFRDGAVNLHYIHVIAQEESGRSCRLCHTEHASRQPMLLRESVPYGDWTLPIRFTPTDDGGTCAAGCHREREYRRE